MVSVVHIQIHIDVHTDTHSYVGVCVHVNAKSVAVMECVCEAFVEGGEDYLWVVA